MVGTQSTSYKVSSPACQCSRLASSVVGGLIITVPITWYTGSSTCGQDCGVMGGTGWVGSTSGQRASWLWQQDPAVADLLPLDSALVIIAVGHPEGLVLWGGGACSLQGRVGSPWGRGWAPHEDVWCGNVRVFLIVAMALAPLSGGRLCLRPLF